MTEITSAPIASLGQAEPDAQDQPDRRLRRKPAAVKGPESANTPEIEAAEEVEHNLDERA